MQYIKNCLGCQYCLHFWVNDQDYRSENRMLGLRSKPEESIDIKKKQKPFTYIANAKTMISDQLHHVQWIYKNQVGRG